jgi:uncharacterized protein YkwD
VEAPPLPLQFFTGTFALRNDLVSFGVAPIPSGKLEFQEPSIVRLSSPIVSVSLLIASVVVTGASLVLFVTNSQQPAAAVTEWAPNETQVMTLINHERAKVGLWALNWDTRLGSAADSHNQFMLDHPPCFSHQCSGELSFAQRLNAAGYQYFLVGEVIGMNQTTPDQVVSAWMASGEHKSIMLNTAFMDMGCGYLYSTSAIYWTCDFGSQPANLPPPPPTATSTQGSTLQFAPANTPAANWTTQPAATATAVPSSTSTRVPLATATSVPTTAPAVIKKAGSGNGNGNGNRFGQVK